MSTDYTQLITSEHNQKPNFVATVALTANGIADITALIASLSNEFDIDNAIGAQLDVVGQWIGQGRQVQGILLVQFFGFADDPTALTFGELNNPAIGGRFVELGDNGTSSAVLQDPEYRTILKAKIIANDFGGTIDELEDATNDIIGVPCQFIDPGTRVVMIIVSAEIDPVIQALLTGYDILPRPAGVRYQTVFLTPETWSTVGTALVSGNQISKPTGSNAWDSSVYAASPASHINLTWTIVSNPPAFMGGLALNPSVSPNFSTLNYGLGCIGGAVQIWESGVNVLNVPGGYAPGDTFSVYWDGNEAVYLHNTTVLRVVAHAPQSLCPMFSIFSQGTIINNVTVSTG